MSESHKRRGSLPPNVRPWSPQEDELVRAFSPREVAKRTGRPLTAVYSRRQDLKLPDGRRNNGRSPIGGPVDTGGG